MEWKSARRTLQDAHYCRAILTRGPPHFRPLDYPRCGGPSRTTVGAYLDHSIFTLRVLGSCGNPWCVVSRPNQKMGCKLSFSRFWSIGGLTASWKLSQESFCASKRRPGHWTLCGAPSGVLGTRAKPQLSACSGSKEVPLTKPSLLAPSRRNVAAVVHRSHGSFAEGCCALTEGAGLACPGRACCDGPLLRPATLAFTLTSSRVHWLHSGAKAECAGERVSCSRAGRHASLAGCFASSFQSPTLGAPPCTTLPVF